MTNDVDVLHHLGLITRDMAATVAAYERLGFAFTPVSMPRIPLTPGGTPEQLGVGNRCAIFKNNYLEMLGIVDAARWSGITKAQRGPYDIDPPMARYEGLHVLHLASRDLEQTRMRLQREGLAPSPIHPFQRMVDTEHGPQMMQARTLSMPRGSDPEALLQIAQHLTPELVLQPRYMNHPNGATSLTEVIVCVEDVKSVADKYAAYSGHPVCDGVDALVIDMGQSRVLVTDAEGLGAILPGEVPPAMPFLAGFTVSADLKRTADYLLGEGIAFELVGPRLMIPARDACGTAVLFEEAGEGRWIRLTGSRVSSMTRA